MLKYSNIRGCAMSPFIRKYSQKTSGHFVILPEIPSLPPNEKNVLLQPKLIPPFASILPEHILNGVIALSIELDSVYDKISAQIKSPSQRNSFTDIFGAVEKAVVPLDRCTQVSKVLSALHGGKYLQAFAAVVPQCIESRSERFADYYLYLAAKEIKNDHPELSCSQSRLLEMYMSRCKISGVVLSDRERDRFHAASCDLLTEQKYYLQKLLISSQKFTEAFLDACSTAELSALPEGLRNFLLLNSDDSSKSPWQIGVTENIYNTFMEHCNNRSLRQSVYLGYNNRCSPKQNCDLLSNSNNIEYIRRNRQKQAKLLGYENYFEMVADTKILKKADEVLNLCENLRSHFKPVLDEEIESLKLFMKKNNCFHDLESFDFPFWRRLWFESLHPIDYEQVKQYFPFECVFNGILKLTTSMFGVEFRDCTKEFHSSLPHPSVTVFEVISSDAEKGYLIVDSQRWQNDFVPVRAFTCQDRSKATYTLPVVYLKLSLKQPPFFMSFAQVKDLFFEFAKALLVLLNTSEYSEVAGPRYLERDAQLIFPTLFSMLLRRYDVIRSICSHLDINKSMPVSLHKKLIAAEDHLIAYDVLRELYLSEYDAKIHSTKINHFNLMRDIWPRYFPFKLAREDYHVCQFQEIYTGNCATFCYADTWSKVIAADIFKTMERIDLSQSASVLKSISNSFLKNSGMCFAGDLATEVLHREPTIDSFIELYCRKNSKL